MEITEDLRLVNFLGHSKTAILLYDCINDHMMEDLGFYAARYALRAHGRTSLYL